MKNCTVVIDAEGNIKVFAKQESADAYIADHPIIVTFETAYIQRYRRGGK